ncbi:MAG: hypothetical protein WBH47_15720 [Streptosporangiaceae bacterium]
MTIEQPTGDGPMLTPRLLITAAVLVGIVIFAFVAVLTRPASPAAGAASRGASAARHPAPAGQRAGPASHSAAAAASPAAAAGGCGVPPGQQAVPLTAPAGVTWQLYDTVALPFSPQAGPTAITGDVARCYAHSPTGALLAAVQIAVRYSLATNWQAVIAQQVMPGTGRNVYAAERPGADVTVQPGQFGQIAAFQFVTYTPALAVVQIVIQLPAGEMQATTMTVQWSADDWRLQLQPDGSPGPNVQQVPNLTGFIPWAGV